MPTHVRNYSIFLPALAGVLAVLPFVSAGHAPGQMSATTPCVTTQPLAEAVRMSTQLFVRALHPDDRSGVGLAAPVDAAMLVAGSTTCAAVIGTHNAHVAAADASMLVSESAVVVRFGTSSGLSLVGGPPVSRETFVYDSTLRFNAVIELMD
ncbi:MAG: hypothetical protein R3B35_12275 [Gemmatimonadales bacterium]